MRAQYVQRVRPPPPTPSINILYLDLDLHFSLNFKVESMALNDKVIGCSKGQRVNPENLESIGRVVSELWPKMCIFCTIECQGLAP